MTLRRSAAAALGGALALAAVGAQAQTVLRYAEYSSDRGVRAEQMQWFADELAARTA